MQSKPADRQTIKLQQQLWSISLLIIKASDSLKSSIVSFISPLSLCLFLLLLLSAGPHPGVGHEPTPTRLHQAALRGESRFAAADLWLSEVSNASRETLGRSLGGRQETGEPAETCQHFLITCHETQTSCWRFNFSDLCSVFKETTMVVLFYLTMCKSPGFLFSLF